MFPLKYKICGIILLLVISVLFFCLLLVSFSHYETGYSLLHRIIPYIFTLCAFAIIASPVMLGPGGHWLMLFISVVSISTLSLATSTAAYSLQCIVLLGLSVNIHYFYKKRIAVLERKDTATQKIKEATNVLKAEYVNTLKLNTALSDRLKKYRSLKDVGEAFSAEHGLDEICMLTVNTAYRMMPRSDSATLFVVDEAKQQLTLIASKKESELPRIKSKHGDIFDEWVFKKREPLNVSDINEDFRFDYKPLKGERRFKSLISVPLISQFRIIGVLRLNSKEKNAYSFDDLRLLDFISDLASTSINNARLYKATEELSIKDSLTGFYIHRYLKTRIEEETERARINSFALSVIMIDVDHFKDYNDRYGHSAGDKVLLGISKIMRNNTKPTHIIARYGGEEFVILLPGVKGPEAKAMAEKIRKDVNSKPFILRRKETRVTISAGVASYTYDIKEKEGLLKKADYSLYRAKKEGRNRVCAA